MHKYPTACSVAVQTSSEKDVLLYTVWATVSASYRRQQLTICRLIDIVDNCLSFYLAMRVSDSKCRQWMLIVLSSSELQRCIPSASWLFVLDTDCWYWRTFVNYCFLSPLLTSVSLPEVSGATDFRLLFTFSSVRLLGTFTVFLLLAKFIVFP